MFTSTKTPIERFLCFIKVCQSGCWEWQGTKSNEYGYFWNGQRNIGAHRFAYEYYVDVVPTGLELDHLCRNPRCVNPDHLEAVTHSKNIWRGILPNRAKTHCPKGHPYSEENTYRPPHQNGRYCRVCIRNRGITNER